MRMGVAEGGLFKNGLVYASSSRDEGGEHLRRQRSLRRLVEHLPLQIRVRAFDIIAPTNAAPRLWSADEIGVQQSGPNAALTSF